MVKKSSHALFIFLFHQILGSSPQFLVTGLDTKIIFIFTRCELRSSNFDTQLPSLRKNLFYFSRLVESKNLSAKKLSTTVRKFPERKIKNFFKNAVRKLCRLFFKLFSIILIFVGGVLQICNKREGIEGITAP